MQLPLDIREVRRHDPDEMRRPGQPLHWLRPSPGAFRKAGVRVSMDGGGRSGDQPSAHQQGGSGTELPVRALRLSAALRGDRRGGGAIPLASPNVAHWVGWLSRRSGQTRPPTVGTLGRQNRHTRILTSPPYAVSTTGKKAMSQGFQRRTRGGPGSASGRPRAAPRHTPRGHPG